MKLTLLASKVALLLIVAALITACSKPMQPTQTSVETGTSQPYPLPGTPVIATPYPHSSGGEENGEVLDTYSIPLPGSDTGVVIGRLIDDANNQPLAGYSIFLATKIAFQNSSEYSYALDPDHSPHSTSDSQGNFAIGDVKPGTYIIMVWTPIRASIVIDAATGKELDVIIVAGETVDIGTHKVTNPMP